MRFNKTAILKHELTDREVRALMYWARIGAEHMLGGTGDRQLDSAMAKMKQANLRWGKYFQVKP